MSLKKRLDIFLLNLYVYDKTSVILQEAAEEIMDFKSFSHIFYIVVTVTEQNTIN